MVEQFAELSYAVIGPAFTIAEARHLAAVASIDAAVVDLNLRGVSADEVADILALRKIPFVFVTGHSHLPDRPSYEPAYLWISRAPGVGSRKTITPCRSSVAVILSKVDCTVVGYPSPWASQYRHAS
jgi:hypothetical protein